MVITRRQAVVGMLGLQVAATVVLFGLQFLGPVNLNQLGTLLGALVLYVVLFVAYYKGWDPARYVNAVIMTLTVTTAISEPFLTERFAMQVQIVPVIILIMADWRWALGSIFTMIGILLFRANWTGIYTDPSTMLLYAVLMFSIGLLWKIAESNAHRAEINAKNAEEARTLAEHEQQLAVGRRDELAKINEEQETLLALVSQLETPAITIADGVLIAPLIGNIDTRRSKEITQRLLAMAYERHVQLVILDVTGVSMMDTTVVHRLMKTAQSLRLLGCEVTISGISADIALSLIQMGVMLDEMVQTARTPQVALEQFLQRKERAANADVSSVAQAVKRYTQDRRN
ncbi:STAS domain-containing protein [Chloroflexia bacterium SDU3-3]|nr:STAS domain-containing protein [Chloroflexia bacterium SDU3-3]